MKGFLKAEGMGLNHIKPHGSLYGMAARMEEMAHAVCDAADVFQVPLMGMINTLHEKVYKARGHRFIAEFYADLDYNDDGGLIITREHEAKDPARSAARCLRAIREGKVKSVGGKDMAVGADAICVHSDTPNAVAIASAVREAVKPFIEPPGNDMTKQLTHLFLEPSTAAPRRTSRFTRTRATKSPWATSSG